mmetsp:Transcript_39527/g.93836  ORF Transcript_39527/g.93836 Transcript_39527/m.93836 type:complete len:81 (+) Transcript_39527:599-841(+)
MTTFKKNLRFDSKVCEKSPAKSLMERGAILFEKDCGIASSQEVEKALFAAYPDLKFASGLKRSPKDLRGTLCSPLPTNHC